MSKNVSPVTVPPVEPFPTYLSEWYRHLIS